MVKRQIRRGVFETNSSSVHTITISAHKPNEHPDSIHFGCGEFGWEVDTHRDYETKASYLWTAIVHIFGEYVGEEKGFFKLEGDEYVQIREKIRTACKNYGIENVTFQETFHKRGWSDDTGYIDHTPYRDFVDDIVNDEDRLIRYLFSDDSCVCTGNDNGDECPDSPTQAVEWDYYKGN